MRIIIRNIFFILGLAAIWYGIEQNEMVLSGIGGLVAGICMPSSRTK